MYSFNYDPLCGEGLNCPLGWFCCTDLATLVFSFSHSSQSNSTLDISSFSNSQKLQSRTRKWSAVWLHTFIWSSYIIIHGAVFSLKTINSVFDNFSTSAFMPHTEHLWLVFITLRALAPLCGKLVHLFQETPAWFFFFVDFE